MKIGFGVLGLLLLTLISFILGIVLYVQMPEQMASHWGAEGEVNGYMSKFWGVFMMPMLLLVMALVLYFVPRADPLKINIEASKVAYETVVLVIGVVLFLVYLQMILWNLGTQIPFERSMPVLFGLMFVTLGVLMPKTKRNWTMGIRTAWSLSSDKVWAKTHKAGGILFIIAGVLSLLGVFFPNYAFAFVFIPIIMCSLGSVLLSYLYYRQEQNERKTPHA